MKCFSRFAYMIGLCLVYGTAYGVSAGAVSANNAVRLGTPNLNAASTNLRGNQGLVNTYKMNQRNTYYMVNVPDVDSACRIKINKCFADYCGDITIVPGQQAGRCAYATQSELYNYALLCLRNDTSVLLPNYATNTKMGVGGMNTAAHLCPSYVQQELMSWLSAENMANELTKAHSPQCVKRRQELEAAMTCHSVALAYGNETSSMLLSQLTDFCGPSVAGGSSEMVSRFANAGNVGANIWGWAEKIVTLDLNKKGADWQSAVDSVLASYTNRMNLACGDNLQINTANYPTTTGPTAIQTIAANVVSGLAGAAPTNNAPLVSVFMEMTTRQPIYDYDTAKTVVNAGLANGAITQNAFLTSAQMADMQKAYKNGTKMFILRDTTRCYMIPVAELTGAETSMIAQQFSTCIYK